MSLFPKSATLKTLLTELLVKSRLERLVARSIPGELLGRKNIYRWRSLSNPIVNSLY